MRWGLEFTTTFSQEKPPRRSLSSGEKIFSIDTWLFFKIFLFLAALSFHCFARGFSLVAGSGGYSSLRV